MTKQNEGFIPILRQIRDALNFNKAIWTINDLCSYTGYTQSYIYKLCCYKLIPHCKSPGGSKLFFKRDEIIKWLSSTDFNQNTIIHKNLRITK